MINFFAVLLIIFIGLFLLFFKRTKIENAFNIKKLNSATALMYVKKDSFFVQGHFPNQPVMPGVLIVEAFGQAAAALTAAGIDKSEYDNKLRPNMLNCINEDILKQISQQAEEMQNEKSI